MEGFKGFKGFAADNDPKKSDEESKEDETSRRTDDTRGGFTFMMASSSGKSGFSLKERAPEFRPNEGETYESKDNVRPLRETFTLASSVHSVKDANLNVHHCAYDDKPRVGMYGAGMYTAWFNEDGSHRWTYDGSPCPPHRLDNSTPDDVK